METVQIISMIITPTALLGIVVISYIVLRSYNLKTKEEKIFFQEKQRELVIAIQRLDTAIGEQAAVAKAIDRENRNLLQEKVVELSALLQKVEAAIIEHIVVSKSTNSVTQDVIK